MTSTVKPQLSKADIRPPEDILVVPRSVLFKDVQAWSGLKRVDDAFFENIFVHHEYHDRWKMEEDESYKQVIPYLVFMNENKVFIMNRGKTGGEKRLASKMTLGIGGHIRKEDVQGADVAAWAVREFQEEVIYRGEYTVHPFGCVNDDSNTVGKVHIGIVYILKGTSDDIKVNEEELAWGELVDINECKEKYYDQMEGWSQMVIDALLQ